MCALACWSGLERCGERVAGAGAPAKSLQVRPQPGTAAPGCRVGRGPLSRPRGVLGPSAPGPLYRTLSLAGIPHPRLLLLSGGLSCRAGRRLGQQGGARTPCCRRCARAAGTKTPLPAPAPAPARSAGRVKGWAPCGEPGHGAVRRLGAPGRCLCNAGTGRSPLVRTWQLSPGIGASVGGQCPLGGARSLGPPGGGSGAGVQILGCDGYVKSLLQGRLTLDPCTMGQKAG